MVSWLIKSKSYLFIWDEVQGNGGRRMRPLTLQKSIWNVTLKTDSFRLDDTNSYGITTTVYLKSAPSRSESHSSVLHISASFQMETEARWVTNTTLSSRIMWEKSHINTSAIHFLSRKKEVWLISGVYKLHWHSERTRTQTSLFSWTTSKIISVKSN